MTRRMRRHPNQPGLLLQKYSSTSQTSRAIAIPDLLRERDCSNAAAPRRAQRDGVRHRSGGYLEPGVCDFGDEFASEARVDAKSALDPLPRLGDDVLVEPLARRLVQRPDGDDSPVVGNLEVAH